MNWDIKKRNNVAMPWAVALLLCGFMILTPIPGSPETSTRYLPGETVRAYAIQQNTLTAGTNYTFTFASANLTITAAALTVSST